MAEPHSRTDATRRELLSLLLASLACIIVMMLGLAEARGLGITGIALRHLLLAAVAAGASGLVVILVWLVLRPAGLHSARAATS